MLAKTYRRKGTYDEALQQLRRASSKASALPRGTGYAGRFQAAVHTERGRIHQENGAFSEAAEAYRRALEVDPQQGETHFYLATAVVELRDYVRAREHLVKAQQLGFSVDAEFVKKLSPQSPK